MTYVITKQEAERALDREEVRRLYQKYGYDTVQTWLFQMKLNLTPADRAEPSRDQLMDLR